ncbi:DUF2290 domain-containing protein [Desulfotalea psychrophila]|uniref:DUF2290 domain-containing protein n=1 Tax=Desulfotalea psychrophila (strain LSv54 / DSM 12343) TaxID=177439 RepID=Q6AR82_DESPS|nr:DUF2290 domain-containing protein [Desulfotalea psychrophila]CAG35142.1 conserved hypothetical protein [Desulfotalea psychrophila LSv54]
MTVKKTQCAIINILKILSERNLLYFYNIPVLQQDNESEMITWGRHERGACYNADGAFGKLFQYRSILENNAFHAILKDGAFIRVSYTFKRGKLKKHSLWYWPCPLLIPNDDIENETPLGALDLYMSNWEEYLVLRSPMRFDFDVEQQTIDHPASHLHFQASSCRMGVGHAMSFGTFIKYIFKNFYESEWNNNLSIWADLPIELDEENKNHIFDTQQNHPHLNWSNSSLP